jgi:hypothetical protein
MNTHVCQRTKLSRRCPVPTVLVVVARRRFFLLRISMAPGLNPRIPSTCPVFPKPAHSCHRIPHMSEWPPTLFSPPPTKQSLNVTYRAASLSQNSSKNSLAFTVCRPPASGTAGEACAHSCATQRLAIGHEARAVVRWAATWREVVHTWVWRIAIELDQGLEARHRALGVPGKVLRHACPLYRLQQVSVRPFALLIKNT